MLERARSGLPTFDGEEFVAAGSVDSAECVAATGPSDDTQSMADATHIARHDPARVLTECAAKRAILDEHDPIDPCDAHDGATLETVVCDTLRILAGVYADHTDYDPSWAVS